MSDLQGILDAQKNYLNQLVQPSGQAGTAGTVGTNLGQLNGALNALDASLNTGTATTILARQADMKKIIDDETVRLQQKQASIKQAKAGQDRLVSLNQSYSKRFSQYTVILIAVVIALVLFLGIIMLKRTMENPPDMLFNILSIIIIAGVIIFCLKTYSEILARDNMNYDELAIAPPTVLSKAQIDAKIADAQKSGNLLGSFNLGGCIGSNCCANGSVWDVGSQTCIVPCPTGLSYDGTACVTSAIAGFTTLNSAYSSNGIAAFTASEFDSYAKV